MVRELISTSRALSSRCSWVLSFLDGEQNETGHKPQSGGKLCDFFERLVLFWLHHGYASWMWFGVHGRDLWEWGQLHFGFLWGWLSLAGLCARVLLCIHGAFELHQRGLVEHHLYFYKCFGVWGNSLHHKLCGGAHGALHRQFRGGAGGSSASSGSQSMQDVMQQLSLVVAKLEAGDRPQDRSVPFCWLSWPPWYRSGSLVTPTRKWIEARVAEYHGGGGQITLVPVHRWCQAIILWTVWGKGFAITSWERRNLKKTRLLPKAKVRAKRQLVARALLTCHAFDLKRIAPSRAIISWQAVAGALEHGDHPPNASIAICDSTARILELQELAAVHEVKASLILVARISKEEEGKQFSDGGKSELLPFQGNIAFVQARDCNFGQKHSWSQWSGDYWSHCT